MFHLIFLTVCLRLLLKVNHAQPACIDLATDQKQEINLRPGNKQDAHKDNNDSYSFPKHFKVD